MRTKHPARAVTHLYAGMFCGSARRFTTLLIAGAEQHDIRWCIAGVPRDPPCDRADGRVLSVVAAYVVRNIYGCH